MAEVWPFLPVGPVGETLSALTEVHGLRDSDARWSLRPLRQAFSLAWNMRTEEYQTARFLFRAHPNGEWLLPVWTEATRGVTVLATDTVIACDMAAEYAPGGKAIVWTSCDSWTVVDVLARGEDGITLAAAVGADHAGAMVMPLRTCICRDGLQVTRHGRELWSIAATFEAIDNPNLLHLIEPLQVTFAIDCSGSMNTEVADGVTRLEIAKQNVVAALYYLEATGLPHDVHVLGWGETASSLARDDCDAGDWQDLRDHVMGLSNLGGTDFDVAFTNAAAFYDGTDRRVFFFVTDGQAAIGTIAPAIALRDAIPDLQVHGINIALDDTTDTDLIDNMTGTQVIAAEGLALYEIAVIILLGLTAWRGLLYLPCAGAVLQPWSGQVFRTAAHIDSGLGTIVIEAERVQVDDTAEAILRPGDAAKRYALKQALHFLGGRDRPFWVPDFRLRIITATATQITVPPIRPAVADWIGAQIVAGGQLRNVTNATTVSGNHRLTVATLGIAPTGRITVLRRVRQMSDEVLLDHARGRWASASLTLGAA